MAQKFYETVPVWLEHHRHASRMGHTIWSHDDYARGLVGWYDKDEKLCHFLRMESLSNHGKSLPTERTRKRFQDKFDTAYARQKFFGVKPNPPTRVALLMEAE